MSRFPEYNRLVKAIDERVNATGACPKSARFGTARKLRLNAELVDLFDIIAEPDTVIQTINVGYGPIELAADIRLAGDALDLSDEPIGASCAR